MEKAVDRQLRAGDECERTPRTVRARAAAGERLGLRVGEVEVVTRPDSCGACASSRERDLPSRPSETNRIEYYSRDCYDLTPSRLPPPTNPTSTAAARPRPASVSLVRSLEPDDVVTRQGQAPRQLRSGRGAQASARPATQRNASARLTRTTYQFRSVFRRRQGKPCPRLSAPR